jgi:raffinose/stachyose/melibiose transport system permease protein
MSKKSKLTIWTGDILGILAAAIIFIIPFVFMFVNSIKDRKEANLMNLSLPDIFNWENYKTVLSANNGQILTAFKNSAILSVGAVVLLIVVGSMAGYVMQRRKGKLMSVFNVLILLALMVPPAILPTIWVMQRLHMYKTLWGMIFIETALQIPFTIMLYRGFMSSIPIELEEAGYIDGCNRTQLFTKIIFPLLKPVTATVIILNAVTIFNDFTNPLYFLPGSKNATVQLTLYNFMGKYASSYNLLFADVIMITLPMLILFIIFNKKIVDGMVAGSVKG